MSINAAAKPQIKTFAISEIQDAEYNPRTIDDESLAGLKESLDTFGLLEVPVVNVHGEPRLISGHQRVRAMREEGYTHVDCLIVDFDESMEKIANVTMNNPHVQGKWDAKLALPNIEAMKDKLPKPDHARLSALQTQLQRLGRWDIARLKDKHEEDAKTEEAPVSKTGVCYALGKHRLYSGSSLDWKALPFDIRKVNAIVTDPPYNVNYKRDGVGEGIENDNMSEEAWETFLADVCETFVRTGAPLYAFMASSKIPALESAYRNAGGVVHQWLFWLKDRPTFCGFRAADYCHQHEPILFGAPEGVEITVHGEAQTNVIEFPRPSKNELHPTQKPLGLIQQLVEHACAEGEIVFDPFSGSGSTLCAAEATGRTCYAIELDLKHVDTIRKRWARQVHGEEADWQKLTPEV